ncbi:MAG: hypothetical protein IJA17_03200 [Oscillospiraceae bacterium]|nr:hypothetical protein [Oscillospiraceae bacterium]
MDFAEGKRRKGGIFVFHPLIFPERPFCTGRNPSTVPTATVAPTLAVPKIFFGIRLEHFDRGAKPCSLFRPLGALRKLCSLGKGGNFILQQS